MDNVILSGYHLGDQEATSWRDAGLGYARGKPVGMRDSSQIVYR